MFVASSTTTISQQISFFPVLFVARSGIEFALDQRPLQIVNASNLTDGNACFLIPRSLSTSPSRV